MEKEELLKKQRMQIKNQELVKRREVIEQRIHSRKELIRSRNQSTHDDPKLISISFNKPLFQKLEDDYKNKILLPELDRSREILKQRKEYMKPVTYTDIVSHKKKYLSDLEEKVERLREKRNSSSNNGYINLNKYKSKLIQQIRERDQIELQKEKEK